LFANVEDDARFLGVTVEVYQALLNDVAFVLVFDLAGAGGGARRSLLANADGAIGRTLTA